MNKSIFAKFLALIIVLCLLPSCGKGECEMREIACSPNKGIADLVTEKYSYSQLVSITKLDLSMEELNKQYPIECLRKTENAYRVSYLGTEHVAVILFDIEGNRIFSRVYSLNMVKDDFAEFIIGQSLTEVQKIDPKGDYLFLYTGSNTAPRVSYHYTKDGYLISIEYDDNNTVLHMTTELI